MRFLAGHNSWIDEYLSEAMWYDLYLMFFFFMLRREKSLIGFPYLVIFYH